MSTRYEECTKCLVGRYEMSKVTWYPKKGTKCLEYELVKVRSVLSTNCVLSTKCLEYELVKVRSV